MGSVSRPGAGRRLMAIVVGQGLNKEGRQGTTLANRRNLTLSPLNTEAA
jgi:hypothetical protein